MTLKTLLFKAKKLVILPMAVMHRMQLRLIRRIMQSSQMWIQLGEARVGLDQTVKCWQKHQPLNLILQRTHARPIRTVQIRLMRMEKFTNNRAVLLPRQLVISESMANFTQKELWTYQNWMMTNKAMIS